MAQSLSGLTAPMVERLREWSDVFALKIKQLRSRELHESLDPLNDLRNSSGRERFDNQLRQIFDSIPALIHTTRPDGYIDYFNQNWLAYVGRSLEDIQGWKWTSSIHPDDVEGILERWRASLATGEPFLFETRVRRSDGEFRWMLHQKVPLRDEHGQIIKWYGSSIDIQDRKLAELSAIIDNAPVFLWSDLPDGYCDFLNQPWLNYFNLSLQEAQGAGWAKMLHPDDAAHHLERWQKSILTGIPFETEARYRGSDGEYRWFLNRANPLRDKSGRIVKWYGTNIDIDNLKRTQGRLRESEAYLAEAQRLSKTGSFGWQPDSGDIVWSDETYRIFEYDRAIKPTIDLVAQRVHPEDRLNFQNVVDRASADKQPFEHPYRLLLPDGTVKHVHAIAHAFEDASGHYEFVGAVMDVTERKRAEDAQARQAGVRADVNAAFSKLTHLGEILRGCTEAIVRHIDAAFARIWMLNKDENMLELRASAGMYTRLDGSYSRICVGDLKVGWIAREKKAHLTNDVLNDPRVNDKDWALYNGMVAFAGYPLVVDDRLIGVMALFARHPLPESILDTLASVADAIAQGIERKRADEELRRAEETTRKTEAELAHMARVATLGELTASIAHEVNQPLGAIVNNAGASLRWLVAQNMDEVRQSIENVIKDGHRASDIIQRIRALVKKTPPQKDRLDLKDIVREVIMLTRAELDVHHVALQHTVSDECPAVWGDRIQIQQVLLNLIMNAIEAMSGTEGSRTLQVSAASHDEHHVLVTVQDSGPGIDPTQLNRLFEAFYSTKAGGLGMGLAISRSIIEAHDGRLWGTTYQHRGATFHFTLPIEGERTV